jgi:hypothetical protein
LQTHLPITKAIRFFTLYLHKMFQPWPWSSSGALLQLKYFYKHISAFVYFFTLFVNPGRWLFFFLPSLFLRGFDFFHFILNSFCVVFCAFVSLLAQAYIILSKPCRHCNIRRDSKGHSNLQQSLHFGALSEMLFTILQLQLDYLKWR